MALYGLSAGFLALLLLVAYKWGFHRGDHHGASQVQAAWDRATAARNQEVRALELAARKREAELAQAAARMEEDLRAQLDTADARGRDLARRLRLHQATRPGGGCLPAPAEPPAGPDGTGGEPGDGGSPGTAADQALEEHLAACARDAERLDGWIAWWASGLPSS
jgi:hypothetical protein